MARAKSAGETKLFEPLEFIRFNGETYGPGGESQVIELTNMQAAPLLAIGHITEIKTPAAENVKPAT